MTHRLAVFLTTLILTAAPLHATPNHYALEPDNSTVAFAYDFGQDEITGRMPVSRADLTLDFATVANSRISVALDVADANGGFAFATQAMKGPKVLDAARYPEIIFQSTRVRAKGTGAEVEGQITIRGVTRPVTLDAQVYRQRDTKKGDLSRLSILLTGVVSRSAFGATGWSDMVGDQVRLKILARIRRDQ